MHDDTRARPAAAGDDVVARLRYWAGVVDGIGDGEGLPFRDAAAAIEARDAEIARLNAEVASLRLTLGGRTFSATVPEPIGCPPLPGMCAQVAEIARLREALERIAGQCARARGDQAYRDAVMFALRSTRAALAPQPASDGGTP